MLCPLFSHSLSQLLTLLMDIIDNTLDIFHIEFGPPEFMVGALHTRTINSMFWLFDL